ncbi:MAG: hypothetical protein DMF60_00685 [Acidobacteria bacterium]|nr:MAG: hypothetical protein DMF60_00685 [Acidobacteriota bacterium]
MKTTTSFLLWLILICAVVTAQWAPQHSATTARFRGVSAASGVVAWASGSGGTYARTTDGGATWRAAVVPGASQLDFRDVQAIDANTAYLLNTAGRFSSPITTRRLSLMHLLFGMPAPASP